jgi:hypothetical protein
VSDTITMRHPNLPAEQEIEVPREAMPHYTNAGWQLVPAEELEKRAAAKAKADAEARAAEETSKPTPADQPEQSEPAEEPTERPARSRRAHEKKTEEN